MENFAPVVYTGPTLSHQEVSQNLPDARLCEPIRRGDLYRDRALGYSVFLIIDGVFLQQEAVSPREILDVIADGALVVGASSMGALRAAECWPGGMRGVGSIYRLYRRGSLLSDDEVVLMFSPLDGSPISLALINIRYSVSRLVKKQILTRSEGLELVESARTVFFADRCWAAIFRDTSIEQRLPELVPLLNRFDLKKMDAYRALSSLKTWLRDLTNLGIQSSRGIRYLIPSELQREAVFNPDMDKGFEERKLQLIKWLIVSGWYRRWQDGAARGEGNKEDRPKSGHKFAKRVLRDTAEPSAAVALLADYCKFETTQMQRLWTAVADSGSLHGCIMKFEAINAASEIRHKQAPCAKYIQEAGEEIAFAHQFDSWASLQTTLRSHPSCTALIIRYRQQLATAKQTRDLWFNCP